jgi:hypothetical protein
VLLKPPLANIDLLNWKGFDRALQTGYDYARAALNDLPVLPRLSPATLGAAKANSLVQELERRIAAAIAAN